MSTKLKVLVLGMVLQACAPVQTLSASELLAISDVNPLRATGMFRNRTVQIAGTVLAADVGYGVRTKKFYVSSVVGSSVITNEVIRERETLSPYVVLSERHSPGVIICYFAQNKLREASAIRINQAVLLRCRFDRVISNTDGNIVLLQRCRHIRRYVKQR